MDLHNIITNIENYFYHGKDIDNYKSLIVLLSKFDDNTASVLNIYFNSCHSEDDFMKILYLIRNFKYEKKREIFQKLLKTNFNKIFQYLRTETKGIDYEKKFNLLSFFYEYLDDNILVINNEYWLDYLGDIIDKNIGYTFSNIRAVKNSIAKIDFLIYVFSIINKMTLRTDKYWKIYYSSLNIVYISLLILIKTTRISMNKLDHESSEFESGKYLIREFTRTFHWINKDVFEKVLLKNIYNTKLMKKVLGSDFEENILRIIKFYKFEYDDEYYNFMNGLLDMDISHHTKHEIIKHMIITKTINHIDKNVVRKFILYDVSKLSNNHVIEDFDIIVMMDLLKELNFLDLLDDPDILEKYLSKIESIDNVLKILIDIFPSSPSKKNIVIDIEKICNCIIKLCVNLRNTKYYMSYYPDLMDIIHRICHIELMLNGYDIFEKYKDNFMSLVEDELEIIHEIDEKYYLNKNGIELIKMLDLDIEHENLDDDNIDIDIDNIDDITNRKIINEFFLHVGLNIKKIDRKTYYKLDKNPYTNEPILLDDKLDDKLN